MKVKPKAETVSFSVKGQIVIPRVLREEFAIEEGTRAYVEATSEGILIKPMTKVIIRRLHGILKRKPGGKPFVEEWAEYKQEEKQLEEKKLARYANRSR